MSKNPLFPYSKRFIEKTNRLESKKNKKNLICHQVVLLTNAIYDELKLVQTNQLSINHIKTNFFFTIKNNNILFVSNDVDKLNNALIKTINELNNGLFDNYGFSRGCLNNYYSGFLDTLEKRFFSILYKSVFTKYYYISIHYSLFMESDITLIPLASKNKYLLESLAKKIEMLDHNTVAIVHSVRGNSLKMLHISNQDCDFSYIDEHSLGETDYVLNQLLEKAVQDHDCETANICIKNVKFVKSMNLHEQDNFLRSLNPNIRHPLEYVIGINRKKKAMLNGKYYINNNHKDYDFYNGLEIHLKDD